MVDHRREDPGAPSGAADPAAEREPMTDGGTPDPDGSGRRAVLKLLGVGVVGGGAYAVGSSDVLLEGSTPADRDERDETDRYASLRSATDRLDRSRGDVLQEAAWPDVEATDANSTAVSFEYEPVSYESLESGSIAAFEAVPLSDAPADRLRIEPGGDRPPEDAAALVLMSHGLTREDELSVSLRDRAVTLRGAFDAGIGVYVGTYEGSALAARGRSRRSARSAARQLGEVLD